MADTILADVESSGIYQIRNLVNGKRYVGSAKCFRVRWNSHRAMLVKGCHHSRHLQASWTKHGQGAFVFEVIETCAVAELIDREQSRINHMHPEFNVCPMAGSTLGRRFTSETKAKIGAGNKGKKHPARSAEYRAKISARHKGRVLRPEHMDALQAGRAKRVFTDDQRRGVSRALREQYALGIRGRDRPPEYREKIAASLRGRTIPPEVRAKISSAQKGIKKGPRKPMTGETLARAKEVGRRLAESRRGTKMRPEVAAAMSARMIGRKLPSAQVEKMAAARLAMWADPQFKARMSAIHKARWAAKKRDANVQPDLQGL